MNAQMADGKQGDGEGIRPGSVAIQTASETLPGYIYLLLLPQTTQNTNTHTNIYSNTSAYSFCESGYQVTPKSGQGQISCPWITSLDLT